VSAGKITIISKNKKCHSYTRWFISVLFKKNKRLVMSNISKYTIKSVIRKILNLFITPVNLTIYRYILHETFNILENANAVLFVLNKRQMSLLKSERGEAYIGCSKFYSCINGVLSRSHLLQILRLH
jgi:hypothetical protein